MTTAIGFNKTGYDPFIDFIKAYAIICVLIGHTLPVTYLMYGLWAGMQVPLFILVQTFHFYKKEGARLNIKKIFQRVVLPFVVVGLLELLFIYLVSKEHYDNPLIKKWLLKGGGYGPGSYYPIIYVQIALLLPCFSWVLNSLNRSRLILFFIVVAEVLEVTCSLIQPPEWLYRLLAIRYLFLILLGWLWVKDGITLNRKMVILSLLSALAIIYFEYVVVYFHVDNEPWFFNTAWTFHRWPCYYFCANGLVFLLHVIWECLNKTEWINSLIKELAKSSYEIFLVQMCVCYARGFLHMPGSVSIFVVWTISILGGIAFNRINSMFFRIKSK